MSELNNNSITFGKYKGKTLAYVLKDRSYCKWLIKQEWFINNYEYLFNRVKEYEPLSLFIKVEEKESPSFLTDYKFFNLIPVEKLEIELTDDEKKCYEFYISMINQIKDKIIIRIENKDENIYDIKAPTRWLQKFEKNYDIKRTVFKTFISSYELPNIPYILERVKKEGGITYLGAKSFLIAKARSEEQEKWWEDILKEKYGEDVGTQFKYENCIFDFLNIQTNTIFECKLALKDFNEEQHIKYKLVLKKYKIIYLISRDCLINIDEGNLYTIDSEKYEKYINNIYKMSTPSYLDELIESFDIIEVDNFSSSIL